MLDALVIAPHPDDAELGMGGTIALMQAQGLRVGVLDLTDGEPTPRGSPETRARATAAATRERRPSSAAIRPARSSSRSDVDDAVVISTSPRSTISSWRWCSGAIIVVLAALVHRASRARALREN
jgi:hypothetical protein